MALLFTVLLAVSAALLGYFLFDFGKRDFLRETEAAIDIEISIVSDLGPDPEELARYIQRRSKDDQSVRFRYENATGAWIGGTIDRLPPAIQIIAEGILGFTLETHQGPQTFAAKIHTFADGSRIVVARNVHELIASHDRFQSLSWLILLLMLLVVLVSFGISYFVVSRINRIAAAAQNIVKTGDLSTRLSIDSRWDDLSNLAGVLNIFLEKIEESMASVREISNNIAHDLRTPLTALRSDIEALKTAPVTDEKIDALLAETDRILSVFQALLRIANIQKGRRNSQIGDVQLTDLLRDVCDLYEPVAEAKDIQLDIAVGSAGVVRGDRDLIFQLFANILDNAVKFSPNQSAIRVQVLSDDRQLAVVIEDQGPGIPETDKGNVFKHFYRGDQSRSTPGHGLGLSLVRAIAELHQAKIVLEDRDPGLRVRVTFQPYQ